MPIAQTSFKKLYVAEGVTRRRSSGRLVWRSLPPGWHIAVMIMNGSGGGINEPRAALYASRGYAALALGYFRCPGRPDYISNMPLEYFQTGLRWILWWSATWRSPHAAENNRTGAWAPYDAGPTPKRLEYALLTALADRRATERARIPVEKIKCPVLLIHGTHDGWWPTDYHCDVIEETLAAVAHSPPVTRLRFPDAGHLILFPYVPTTTIVQAHAYLGYSPRTVETPVTTRSQTRGHGRRAEVSGERDCDEIAIGTRRVSFAMLVSFAYLRSSFS